ncbi:hypothetical protein AY599_11445 [Leptolyngbya valderiana BDU 20041]|nr:hypothetical protein AY599_11445 [Leptolyngbya valderiana BDU 20041]
MWAYVLRRILYNIPVYMGVILFLMILLRLTDPVTAYLGKYPTYDQYTTKRSDFGLDKPLLGDWQIGGRTWESREGGLGGSYLEKGRGTGKAHVQWTFDLPAGTYKVQATWPSIEDNDGNAQSVGEAGLVWVRLIEGDIALRTVSMDQTRPPRSIEVDGTGWADLGSVDLSSGDPFTVRVLDDSSKGVVIDAIRIEPVRVATGEVPGPMVADADPDAPNVEIVDDPWTVGGWARSLWDNQYFAALGRIVTLRFNQKSWSVESQSVGEIIATSIVPSLSVTLPVLVLTTLISTSLGLLASFNRGKPLDRGVMFLAVLGMSISYLVYVIVGQYFGAQWPRLAFDLEIFSTFGYEPVLPIWSQVKQGLIDNGVEDPGFFNILLSWFGSVPKSLSKWPYYCLLPVIIGVIVAMGYDTRFYRAVMVEECNKDYIRTARAKGASNRRVMYRHMLRNALIPIITRVMISLPFIIMGSLLVEIYFGIPGMGQQLFTAITNKDFPVVEAITALLAALFIITNILTDVLYAVVDPRVTLK